MEELFINSNYKTNYFTLLLPGWSYIGLFQYKNRVKIAFSPLDCRMSAVIDKLMFLLFDIEVQQKHQL